MSCVLHLQTCVCLSGGGGPWNVASLPVGYFSSSLRWWQDFCLCICLCLFNLSICGISHAHVWRSEVRSLVLSFHAAFVWFAGAKRTCVPQPGIISPPPEKGLLPQRPLLVLSLYTPHPTPCHPTPPHTHTPIQSLPVLLFV